MHPGPAHEAPGRRALRLRGFGRAVFGGARLAALMSALLAGAGAVQAQSVNCTALQAQIVAAGRQQASPQVVTYQRAAQKQQAELARTVGYANSLGCNRRQFLFFGDPPPPQCGALNQRIAAMQGNLGKLQSVAQNGAGEQRRRMLTAQYDAYCRNQVAAARPGNFFEQLFGSPRMTDVPVTPDTPGDDPFGQKEESGPRRGSMAVCVRKCDGGFFPVSYSAGRNNLDELEELCKALCPNAETILFTKRPNAEIEEAVSSEGESYESLSNAGRFKKRFDPACGCKPKHRSWAEALAEAEKLIASKNRRDLIVTPQRAEELSRPRVAVAAARAARATQAQAQTDEDRTVAALEREGKIEAEAASRASAGIAPGRTTSGQRYGVTEGRRETLTTPSGEKRSIRVVGPKI